MSWGQWYLIICREYDKGYYDLYKRLRKIQTAVYGCYLLIDCQAKISCYVLQLKIKGIETTLYDITTAGIIITQIYRAW